MCGDFAKKPLDVVHRYMNKYLCKTVSVQCVQTLNYYARKIKVTYHAVECLLCDYSDTCWKISETAAEQRAVGSVCFPFVSVSSCR